MLEASDADLVVCEVGPGVEPDAVTLDAVARLQLAARRRGRRVYLRHVPRELAELLAFTGLAEVVGPASKLVELRREPEEREEALGVEEGRELDDLAV